MNKLKDKIIMLRNGMGISQKELAKILHTHQPRVCLWELGKSIPSGCYLRKIINLCDEYEIEITREDILNSK